MLGFCGAVGADPQAAANLMDAIARDVDRQSSSVELCRSEGVAIAGYGPRSLRPSLVEHDGVTVAVFGHPRLRGAPPVSADVSALAKVFRQHGAAALDAIEGDFALAAWNAHTRQGLLAVDRIGIRQLVYAPLRDGLAFACSIDPLFGHPGVDRTLSPQALFEYLYFHVVPGPQTIYRSIYRLPAAHMLEFGLEHHRPPRPYWALRFREDAGARADELSEHFVALLQAAVARAAAGADCGAFLSGGTDSSTVSGMLARLGGGRARAFSIGFDVPDYDEMQYARIAARHFGCEHYVYYVTPSDVVDSAPRIAAHYDQPFGNASAVASYFCAKLAHQHGIQRLLAGDGGDELFGGNARYAKQQLLAYYHCLPAYVRRMVVEPLVLSTPLLRAVPGLRKLYRYVQQAHMAMPRRYEESNLLQHLGLGHLFAADFLELIDRERPQRLLQQAYAPYAESALINQMLGIDLRFTLADNDLPKVTRTCELAGVDVAFPLLDDDIVAFAAQLPPQLKLRGTQLRWFFKRALRGFLPPQIIAKRKHGFGVPVGIWLTEVPSLRELAVSAIDRLRPLGMLRAGFVDDLWQRRLPEHPAYFGTMVWLLMMLGLWLDTKRAA